MITCKLLLCAQGVVRDAEHGGISVFNILEVIQAAGFPMLIQQMDILAVFEREREDPPQHEVHFRISIADTELLATTLAIDFEDKLRNRSMLHVQGIVIPHPGNLIVSARLADVTLRIYEVTVEQIGPPPVEAHQEPAGAESRV